MNNEGPVGFANTYFIYEQNNFSFEVKYNVKFNIIKYMQYFISFIKDMKYISFHIFSNTAASIFDIIVGCVKQTAEVLRINQS